MLLLAVPDLDGGTLAVVDQVVTRIGDVELATRGDGTAVVAVEPHVVGAVPGPGARLVACRRSGVVCRAADVDPLRGQGHVGHEEAARYRDAHGARDQAAGRARPVGTDADGGALIDGVGEVPLAHGVLPSFAVLLDTLSVGWNGVGR